MPFSGSTEKLFYDNAASGWKMAKERGKPVNRNITRRWWQMKPDEVIDELKKLGVEMSRSTLLNYEKWGLIPEPKRGGAGKGKGRTTDYPDDTPAEACAAWALMNGFQKLRREDVKKVRTVALKAIEQHEERPEIEISRHIQNIVIDDLRQEFSQKGFNIDFDDDYDELEIIISQAENIVKYWYWIYKDPKKVKFKDEMY